MSVWPYFRKKRVWIAVGVSVGLLLILWGIGAALIEEGIIPAKMQSGWISGTSLCTGFLGGCMVCEKKTGTLQGVLALTVILLMIEIIMSWILYGGIDLGGGAWKNMVMLLVGSLLAGFVCAGKRGGGKRKGRRTSKPRTPIRR